MNAQPDPAITVGYYDRNAEAFIARTRGVSMEAAYDRFLPLLPAGGRILDAGCGSGRDSLAFLQKGYSVVPMDGSSAMVHATTALTGQAALLLRFDEMSFHEEFDGVWACASLLHVPKAEVGRAFQSCLRALKPDGVWYVSFKAGEGEVEKDGRWFNFYTEDGLRAELNRLQDAAILDVWTSVDARPESGQERWTQALVRRVAGPARFL